MASYVPSERHLRFVYLMVGQMLLATLALASLNSFSIDHFVVISFMLMLLTVQFTAPLAVTVEWRARLRWFLLAALLLFGYVAFLRVRSLWIMESSAV